jgi:hypothetical protein
MKNLKSILIAAILSALVQFANASDPQSEKSAHPATNGTGLETTPLAVAKRHAKLVFTRSMIGCICCTMAAQSR